MLLGFMNNPRVDPLAEVRWAAANGFEFVDFTIEGPAASPERVNPQAIRAVLDDAGMGVVGHTAWYLPFASPVERVRRAAVEEVAAQLPIFAALGAALVNVHIERGRSGFKNSTVYFNSRSFAELAELAERHRVRIMVEHAPFAWCSVQVIRGILNAHPRLGFHLDVGHVHAAGLDLAKVLDALGDRLCHVHLSDNRGMNDDHMPIGAGTIDWPAALGRLKRHGYDGTITLEVFDQDHDFLLLSARKVRQWWAEA